MGGTSSKFRKQLQRGEEYAALQLCERHPELRKSLDPNSSYGEQHAHNTPLLYAAKHSMRALVRLFLTDLGGNPNKKNADEATALMLICQGGTRMSRHLDDKIRSECLSFMLNWQGPQLADGVRETAQLDAQDVKKNTALHYAASSGLTKCVELLVCKGANLTVENEAKETACDVAERFAFHEIAEFLETKMVFSGESHPQDINEEDLFPVVQRFSGLREQDLMEAKDLLLVETSDMLQVPLFTAEAMLRNHEWSREALWLSWNRDPVACCEKSGVHAPVSAFESRPSFCDSVSSRPVTCAAPASTANEVTIANVKMTCEVCANEVESVNDIVSNGECGHRFCKPCWKQYATVKIEEGDLHSIGCPAFECSKLVPIELIELVVSPSVARKYLTFDIKAFVDSNPRIKWCPFPGCSNAVRLPDVEEEQPMYLRAFPKLQPPPPTSRAVYCPQGHSFCWECLTEGHEPTSCEKWQEWHVRIAVVKPEELKDTAVNSETAANCLWLVTHSKPCPKCRSPIQKNEGCNHMKCSKCKHDFCWVCLGQWKRHGTETGGYFRCNRFDDSRKVDEKTEVAISEAKEQSRKAQELNRFVHYYSRYKNHLNSFEMESSVRDRITAKIQSLSRAVPKMSVSGNDEPQLDFSFVGDAVEELLRARKVLSSSYAYGYFLKDCGYNKTIFEYLQNELEVSVETLSGLVGRSYLRGSRQRIALTTQLVASRKQRFLLCISRGLVPPETPPALRKAKRRHLPALLGLDKDDDDWVKRGLPPEQDLDPTRPWVKDSRGRHHNLLAILDWPELNDVESDDEDDSFSPSAADEDALRNAICSRPGCTRARARNPRTGDLHDFCSLKCRYLVTEHDSDGRNVLSNRQYNVDLMIALQMSRLQLLQDLKTLSNDDSDDDDVPCASTATSSRRPQPIFRQQRSVGPFLGEDIDPDLQMAIERSMSESMSAASSADVGKMRMDSASVHQLLKRIVADKQTELPVDNVMKDDDVTVLTGKTDKDKCGKVLLKDASKVERPSSSLHAPDQVDDCQSDTSKE